jgi:hypothetical protein
MKKRCRQRSRYEPETLCAQRRERNMEAKYTAKTNLELDDFRRYAKTMGGQPRGLLLTVIVLLWILYSGVTNLRSGRFAMGGLMVAVVVICPLIYLYTSRRQSVKYFERLKETGGTDFTVFFYEDHFETESRNGRGNYAYKDLKNKVETDTDFYLEVEAGHCVIIQKKNCSQDLIGFLHDLK